MTHLAILRCNAGGIWIKIHLNPILITELLMTNQHNSTAEHFLMFFRTRGRVFRLVLVDKLLLCPNE
jgi:hypothetical protein